MTRSRALLIALVLVAGCAVASAQEVGAGKVEFGGWPGGGLILVGGDDNTEVNFNNWTYGGGASLYLNPMAAIEVEASYGLGMAQGVNYHNKEVFHVQVPNTLGLSGNIVIFPGGSPEAGGGVRDGRRGECVADQPELDQAVRDHGGGDVHRGERGRRGEDLPRRGRPELGFSD